MFEISNMAIGAGPLYTNAVMGQVPSAADREIARQANSSILRQDHIHVEESSTPSRPDSFSVHYDCTSQAPYADDDQADMITQHSLLHLPPDNPSHDLAFFLRTTGPTQPHRRPSRLESPGSGFASRTKGIGTFLRSRRPSNHTPAATSSGSLPPKAGISRLFVRGRENEDRDVPGEVESAAAGGETSGPQLADQKVSTEGTRRGCVAGDVSDAGAGTRYLALRVEDDPRILESRISVVMMPGESATAATGGGDDDGEVSKDKQKTPPRPPTPATELAHFAAQHDADAGNGAESSSRAGVLGCPPASSPPTPEPASAISMSHSYWSGTDGSTAKQSFDTDTILSSNVFQARAVASSPLPNILRAWELSQTEERDPGVGSAHLRYPSPQRYVSQPLPSQQYGRPGPLKTARSASESPGPPPRSPLRPHPGVDFAGRIQRAEREQNIFPGPTSSTSYFDDRQQLIRSTVTTDCTGPIKRPKSRGPPPSGVHKSPALRPLRDGSTQTRRVRDKPVAGTPPVVDAVVNVSSASSPRQRLKKARPHIHVPSLTSSPLTARASSSTSSSASWKKITEYTRPPFSAVPSEDARSNNIELPLGNSAFPRDASQASRAEQMAFSPVMLVAEENPAAVKAKSPPAKPAKPVVKEGKVYAPRPRSASLPSSSQRKSRQQAIRTPSRPNTPSDAGHAKGVTPPLPSPPPNRALPPIPSLPIMTTGDRAKVKGAVESNADENKALPLASSRPQPTATDPQRTASTSQAPQPQPQPQPQVTKLNRKPVPPPTASTSTSTSTDIYARVEALEKKNAQLLDRINAMVLHNQQQGINSMAGTAATVRPMKFVERINRREAASRFPHGQNVNAHNVGLSGRMVGN